MDDVLQAADKGVFGFKSIVSNVCGKVKNYFFYVADDSLIIRLAFKIRVSAG
jgi:hypothetical protein